MAASVVVVMIVVVMMLAALIARADVVPCTTSEAACRNASSVSWVNNTVYCCLEGFSMSYSGGLFNGRAQNSCTCQRSYYESDCLQGVDVCQNATNFAGDRCCVNGESMSIVANSIVNGVPVDYCKCRRYVSYTIVNGVWREMTPEEQARFNAEMAKFNADMAQWSNNFNHRMNQWSQNFNQQMNQFSQNLQQSLGNMFRRRVRSTRASRADNLLDLMQRRFQ